MMTLSELVPVLDAQLRGDGATRFTSVGTDSRRVQPGSLFVALRGERWLPTGVRASTFRCSA